jgi:hypothetical protein
MRERECDVGDAAGVQESGERCLVGECVEVNSTVVAPKTSADGESEDAGSSQSTTPPASQAHPQLPHVRKDELVRDVDKRRCRRRRCSSGFLASEAVQRVGGDECVLDPEQSRVRTVDCSHRRTPAGHLRQPLREELCVDRLHDEMLLRHELHDIDRREVLICLASASWIWSISRCTPF